LDFVAYAGIKVLAPAFYAIDKRKTPMIVSFVAIGVNLVLNGILNIRPRARPSRARLIDGLRRSDELRRALLSSCTAKRTLLGTKLMLASLFKMLIAGALLAAVCWSAQHWLFVGWAGLGLKLRLLYLFTTIAVGAVVFFGAATLLQIEELADLRRVVQARLSRLRSTR
jgi:putative peptidoglycan lipid II flippase